MAGSFDLTNSGSDLAGDAVPIVVAKYDGSFSSPQFSYIPNVRCLRIDFREGPDPPVARFDYVMDDTLQLNLGWPSQFEYIWPLDALGPYVVKNDDRLVVLAGNPDGSVDCLFDGYASIPQADVSAQSQSVTFVAHGIPIRLWDNPVVGSIRRDTNAPTIVDSTADYSTDLACHFNPSDHTVGSLGGFLPNSTPTVYETEEGDAADAFGQYPVFVETLLTEREIVDQDDYVAPWYISDAVKYLIATQQPLPDPSQNTPLFPDFKGLTALLNTQYPIDDGLANAGTLQIANMPVRDYNAANKPLMEVIAELLGYCGFLCCWRIVAGTAGLGPATLLDFYRRDAAADQEPKPVYLEPSFSGSLDPTANNVTQLHLALDGNQIINAWQVETPSNQVEATFRLAPLFIADAGDEQDTTKFFKSNLNGADVVTRRKYRWFGADECGDGHWNVADNVRSSQVLDLSPLFPADDNDKRTYSIRYRPGSQELNSRDTDGRPLRATLEVALDQSVEEPYVQEGPSPLLWYKITHGWKLLKDRLGIELTVENPDDWSTGNETVGKITTIWDLANPTGAGAKKWMLRLTTVIDDDFGMGITAPKRLSSPTRFTRYRVADARDHFQYCWVSEGSIFWTANNAGGPDKRVVIRDDTAAAQAHAYQLRSASEFPPIAGTVVIPYLTKYYQLGDRINLVYGRNASLQVNIGTDQGETPVYPWIVGFSYVLENDRQQTVLQLSDHRRAPRNAW